jgi:hypothetical protein
LTGGEPLGRDPLQPLEVLVGRLRLGRGGRESSPRARDVGRLDDGQQRPRLDAVAFLAMNVHHPARHARGDLRRPVGIGDQLTGQVHRRRECQQPDGCGLDARGADDSVGKADARR